jgi:hypothetical protein
MVGWLTWDRAGSFGESGGPSVGMGAECDVESQHLQGCSPCLCRWRTDGLAPASKYWTYWSNAKDMGLVNWCSMFVNRCFTFITISMTVWEEKLGGQHANYWAGVLGIVSGAFFSVAVRFVRLCWVIVKGYHIQELPVGSVWVEYMIWNSVTEPPHKWWVHRPGSDWAILGKARTQSTHVKHIVPYIKFK